MKTLAIAACLLCVPAFVRADDANLTPAPPTKDHLTAIRWIRRATLAGSCIAGTVVNNWALHQLASQPNVQLSGPFISGGKPQYGALLGLGAGSCALGILLQEKHIFAKRETRSLDMVYTFENLGFTGLSVWETLHFLSLADQARAARVQPGTLAPAALHP